jgi:riboflavin kinase/FMN adenylyltransferase
MLYLAAMKIINGINNYISGSKPVYAAMGAFDGIHHGHSKLISMAVDAAHKNNGEAVVLTFKPHPRCFISSDKHFDLITTYEHKEKIIAGLNVDTMVVIDFNEAIAAMPPVIFIEEFLVKSLKVSEVFVGFNFYFGANRSGNTGTLLEAGSKYGFKVNILSPIEIGNFVVSSSKIRLLIEAGAVNDVIKFMGRPFKLTGEVIHGDGLGRKLNIPTANIKVPDSCIIIPKPGVYAVKCRVKGAAYKAVMNIGMRPTVYEKKSSLMTFELHILDFNDDIYGEVVETYFIKRLRDEKKFTDFKALCAQIKADISFAAEYFDESENI